MTPVSLFEKFSNPSERARATAELASLGVEAIQPLHLLFSGEAKNSFGVPYRQLGMPLDCGLVVAGRLGPLAKPLEKHLREALAGGHIYAAEALGQLGTLAEESIEALVTTLVAKTDIAFESACALVYSGCSSHPAVAKAVRSSSAAAVLIGRAASYLARKQGGGAPAA